MSPLSIYLLGRQRRCSAPSVKFLLQMLKSGDNRVEGDDSCDEIDAAFWGMA
jgi:hypothetical protein